MSFDNTKKSRAGKGLCECKKPGNSPAQGGGRPVERSEGKVVQPDYKTNRSTPSILVEEKEGFNKKNLPKPGFIKPGLSSSESFRGEKKNSLFRKLLKRKWSRERKKSKRLRKSSSSSITIQGAT